MNQQARAREKTTASAAEQQFHLLADALPQIVWSANSDGAIQYFNQRWFDYTGLSVKEAQGSGWQSAIHPDDLQIYLDRWNKSLRTGENCEVELRLRHGSDASYHWQLSRALPLKEERTSNQMVRDDHRCRSDRLPRPCRAKTGRTLSRRTESCARDDCERRTARECTHESDVADRGSSRRDALFHPAPLR